MSTPPLDNPFLESRLNNSLDYRPEWDVPTLNEGVVQSLLQVIHQAQGRDQANPEQLIPVILAAPGYGKTHVFGRVNHLLRDEVFFVFVPGIDDLTRPLEHISRYAVESLFRATPGRPSVLVRALARLCQPSLVAYIGQFPPSLAARFQGLLHSLNEFPEQACEIAAAVKELPPFHRLADSIADGMRGIIPHDVIKALAMGWSPAATQARRWLKGESLPEEELGRLGVGGKPPQPLDVLHGISAILQYRIPMVICCDQFEIPIIATNSSSTDLVTQITARLMSVLEKVPNQVLIISCLEQEWDRFEERAFKSFTQRVQARDFKLQRLKEDQGLELIARRLEAIPGRKADAGRTWPFDEASLRSYLHDKRPTPRALIQKAKDLFEEWIEGGRQGSIRIRDQVIGPDPVQAFLQLWNQELEKVRSDGVCEPEDYPEERLALAVGEALAIARDAGRAMGGVRIRNIQSNAIPQAGAYTRYGHAADVASPQGSYTVLIPVSALNNSKAFWRYFNEVKLWIDGPAAGALLVHRLADFEMGKDTRNAFDAAVAAGKLRVFAMEENAATLERLECLVRLLKRAAGGEVQIDGVTLAPDDCRDYVIKASVLDNLAIFKELGGWKKAATATKVSAVAQPVGAATVAGAPGGAASTSTIGTGFPPPGSTSLPREGTTSHPPTGDGDDATTAAIAGDEAKPVEATTLPAAGGQTPTPAKSLTPAEAFQAKYEGWAGERLEELCKRLNVWGQPVRPAGVEVGPTFARLKIEPSGSKTTFNKIRDKATDISIHLELEVTPLIGRQAGHISVDVQLPERRVVRLAEALDHAPPLHPGQPAYPAGMDVGGKMHWTDLSDTSDCHLLVAGQTGSGKSEFLRALVAGLARRLPPQELRFILIDPKVVTFNLGRLESPYLLFPIAYETEQALPLLAWCMDETRRRYELLAEQKKTNVGQLEEPGLVPRVVVVVDEFANLLEDKATKPVLTSLLKQIGSMARAAGIHLVLATQRPDKDVVTPLLRSNLPGRVALRVQTEADSKLILQEPDAAYLLGKGDLLWAHGGGLVRLQSPFVTQEELEQALRAH